MKQIKLLACCLILASCSINESDELKNDKLIVTDHFENKIPAKLIGEYVSINRPDCEPGTLRITKDSIISETTNHRHAFKITDYHNQHHNGCWFIIRVNDIEYYLSTSDAPNSTWFRFVRQSDAQWNQIGTYVKKTEPVTEPQEPIYN